MDIGLIFVEPDLQTLGPLAFRDPVLSETLYTFGYPRVPMAREAALVMQRGEVTAESVTLIHGQSVFLFSAIARPGNSGGPILSETGHVLGVVAEELAEESGPTSLPFHAGITTSTICEAIADIEPSIRLPVETYE